MIRTRFISFLLACAASCVVASDQAERRGPGEHTLALKVGEQARRYIVHVPPSYTDKTNMPVVIMFHGGGGTARGAMRETGWAQKADREGFLAVFPEATLPDPTKPSRFGSNGQTWNDGSGRFHSGERNVPDVAFVNVLLDDLAARFAVDSHRIYATGFSIEGRRHRRQAADHAPVSFISQRKVNEMRIDLFFRSLGQAQLAAQARRQIFRLAPCGHV